MNVDEVIAQMSEGCWGFAPGIDRLLNNRIYRSHTVDAVLQDAARPVTPSEYERLAAAPDGAPYGFSELAARRPLLAMISKNLGDSEDSLGYLKALAAYTKNLQHAFPSPDHSNASGYYRTPLDFTWGGTEEQVIAKGSDWCSEVARVYCALAQLAGIPSRVVYIFSKDDGHVLAECYLQRKWLLIDPLAPKLYMTPSADLIGIVDVMMASREVLDSYTSHQESYYVDANFFQFSAVTEYRIHDAQKYDYSLSHCNEFYRKLLEPIWNR